MTRHSEADRAQLEFERQLLDSAHGDSLAPGATERAWQRFAIQAGALAALASPAAPSSWWRSPSLRALKWLAIGALGGGTLVALLLQPYPQPLEAASGPPPLSTPTPTPLSSPSPSPSSTPSPSPLPSAASSPKRLDPRHRRPSTAPLPPRSSDSLAREVAALDSARTALAVGADSSALQQIERYRRDFPRGALAAEADVVAIEALAAAGERAAARRAAETFLELRPNDPHAARVRELR